MADRLIVVPLDGSELSEAALPYALAMARAAGGRLLLVTVWEGAEELLAGGLPALADDVFKLGEQHYEEYLAGVAKNLDAGDVAVEAQVRVGHPVEEILRLADERRADLIALATHGRSGLGRWMYGSVASKLLHEATLPTLLIGPRLLEAPAAPSIARILVPLNGSELSEAALEPAAELAQAFGASLVLAQVLQWASRAFVFGVPSIDIAQLDRDLGDAAQAYLARKQGELQTKQLVETRVLRGFPADALIELVAEERIGLVVMASHARAGLARAALGSVADRMLQGPAPVLLVRPEAAAAPPREPRGRFCHACGRAVAYGQVLPDDRCPRCGQHLHSCANCVFHDGIDCLLKRSEVHDPYPGQRCPEFHFRETLPPARKE